MQAKNKVKDILILISDRAPPSLGHGEGIRLDPCRVLRITIGLTIANQGP